MQHSQTTGFKASNAQLISRILQDWLAASDYMQSNKFITVLLTVFDVSKFNKKTNTFIQ